MDIEEAKEGDVTILAPSEGLNTQTCAPFEKKLLGVLDAKARLIVVDMKKVDYLSSAALRVLLMVTRRLMRAGGKLVISGLRDEVRKVFSISGFDRDFTIVGSRADAVALAAATPLPPLKDDKKPKTETRAPAAAPANPFAPQGNPFAAPPSAQPSNPFAPQANPFAAQPAAKAPAPAKPAPEAAPEVAPAARAAEPAEPATVMAEQIRPNPAAAQVLRVLATGEIDTPWSRWPAPSVSDALVGRIRERLAL